MTFLGVGEWLARRSELTPTKVGLVDGETGARYTWQALNLRALALAALLRERYGVRQGDRVAVLALNAPEYLDAFYACALLGAILVPLNWRLTPIELTTLLGDSAPGVLLADERFAGVARDVAARQSAALAVLPFADFPGANETLAARAVPFTTADGEEPVVLLYTSGTTGIPKGALLSHRMITWNAINTQISWGLREDDITPTFAPLFHAGGINVLTTPLAHCGGTVVLLRSSEPVTILRTIAAEHCTIVFAVPTVFQRMMEHPAFETTDWSSVRFCVTGGSSCPLPVIERYAARGLVFRQGYGLTEVGVNCFSLAPEDALRKAGSVGQPVFHSRARIVDEDGNDVPPGSAGELALAGPHVCSGYWRRPDATAEALRDGWWHTGDLAMRDADGYFFIVGRKKDMYISGGENIYPAEIENVLATHPDIVEAAVIAEPDDRWGEVGVAVVAPRVSDALTGDAVIAYCGERLARYKLPRRVVFVESLPRNAMGKIIKQELRERYINSG
ncbi:MAG TPA: long-chain fatty acid--CoA ligase [Ktedonobacterales bacterium]|nr:long-chain fatty acid--CoA ligase [Ktedonobacterales bacterium]